MHSCAGQAFSVVAGGRTATAAGFVPDDSDLGGRIVLDFGPFDWVEEAEPVIGHPHDPFKRIDVLASGRHVVVSYGGEVLADSRRPMALFETYLPTRWYLPADDVRLEVGNKLSFMGIFQNIIVQQLPVSVFKMAIVNHWQGQGSYLSEVRILTPDRQQAVVVSQPTPFEIASGGYADNISFFVNITFPVSGRYVVQTLIDSNLFQEQMLFVSDVGEAELVGASEAVN